MKREYITKDDILSSIEAWCNLDAYYHDKRPKSIPISEVKHLIKDIKPLSETDMLNLIVNNHVKEE